MRSTLCLVAALACTVTWAMPDIFSISTTEGDLVPVQIYNHRDKGYVVKMNVWDDYNERPVNSGACGYTENEVWYLVGTAESFKMYNHAVGFALALTLSGGESASAATLAPGGTDLCLTRHDDGSYAISPKANVAQSFNMYGGNGADIKLYSSADNGSRWHFRRIDMTKALTINYNATLEGGYEQNYKIGELSINIAGVTSKSMLDKTNIPASRTCYLPEGAEFGISTGLMCHGWTMTFNGSESLPAQVLPEGGLTVNVNIAVDENNKYQYLFYSPGPNGKPYRIPAIATTANGYVFAINDYRPCGNDIGYGEVDIKCRISKDNGLTWGDEFFVADGQGGDINVMTTGFGDAAVVADRENNEILVMSVCGNRLCWDGNYGDGGENEQDQKDKEQQQDKQDEKQNQQQNQDKKQEEKNQQDQQSQQKEEQPNMSKENAERILQAAMRNEKETQEKIQRQQQDTPRRRLLKQW